MIPAIPIKKFGQIEQHYFDVALALAGGFVEYFRKNQWLDECAAFKIQNSGAGQLKLELFCTVSQ